MGKSSEVRDFLSRRDSKVTDMEDPEEHEWDTKWWKQMETRRNLSSIWWTARRVRKC